MYNSARKDFLFTKYSRARHSILWYRQCGSYAQNLPYNTKHVNIHYSTTTIINQQCSQDVIVGWENGVTIPAHVYPLDKEQ